MKVQAYGGSPGNFCGESGQSIGFIRVLKTRAASPGKS
jgi:hypothetical protein